MKPRTILVVASAFAATSFACGSEEPSSEETESAVTVNVHRELRKGLLALSVNIPARVTDCLARKMPSTTCADTDKDGLVDAWERVVLTELRPEIEFDEGEPLLHDPSAKMGLIGRVFPGPPGASFRARANFVIAYSQDFGKCGFTAHKGDLEKVEIELEPAGASGDVVVTRVFAAAHTSGSRFEKFDLPSALRFSSDNHGPRWLVYSSRAKHATFVNPDVCGSASWLPCMHESCAADNVGDVKRYRKLLPVINAGEPGHPLDSNMAPVGFAEDAWSGKDFCGGLSGTPCVGSVANKLIEDPLAP